MKEDWCRIIKFNNNYERDVIIFKEKKETESRPWKIVILSKAPIIGIHQTTLGFGTEDRQQRAFESMDEDFVSRYTQVLGQSVVDACVSKETWVPTEKQNEHKK